VGVLASGTQMTQGRYAGVSLTMNPRFLALSSGRYPMGEGGGGPDIYTLDLRGSGMGLVAPAKLGTLATMPIFAPSQAGAQYLAAAAFATSPGIPLDPLR